MKILLEQTHNATLVEERGTTVRFIVCYKDRFWDMKLSDTLSKQRRYCKALLVILARYEMDLSKFGFVECSKTRTGATHRDRHANFVNPAHKALQVVDA